MANQFSSKAGEEIINLKTGERSIAAPVQDVSGKIGGDQGQFYSSDFAKTGTTVSSDVLKDIAAGGSGYRPASMNTDSNGTGVDINNILSGINLGDTGISTSEVSGGASDLRTRLAEIEDSGGVDQKERNLLRAQIEEQYRPKIENLEEFRTDQERASTGKFGANRRLSTAATQFIDTQKQRVTKQITELEKMKEDALNKLDTTMIAEADKKIQDARDFEFKITQFENSLASQKLADISNMLNIKEKAASLPLDLAKKQFDIMKEIPEGETMNIGGIDFTGIAIPESEKAFFTGSNIISLMGTIPRGETQEITDPNTGITFTITGTEDPATIQATDDQGNVSIIDKATGQVLNKIEGVGKTKTQASNVSLQIKQDTANVLASISDALDADKGADGKSSPAKYGEQQNKFVRSGLGDANDYKQAFPPVEYLSTDNPDSIQYFQTSSNVLKKLEEGEEDVPDWLKKEGE